MRTLGKLLLTVTTALSASSSAQAAPLSVAMVGAPAINCVFNKSCKLIVSDSTGEIPLPGISGTARLQSRTFTGAAGAPGAGKTGYMYRVNLTETVATGKMPCVNVLTLDFGPVTKLQYNGAGRLDDVFVITSGGLGSIGVVSAEKVGNVIAFTFSKPVCAGSGLGKGETSFFFGLAAPTKPRPLTAQVQVSGGPLVKVPARVPTR